MSISKILSKRGQISMELGILIFATIIVSTIAVYYYITNYLNSNPDAPGKAANKTIDTLNNISKQYSNSISSITP
ncbi:class III signal peptide-containing protein [Methanothermococcus sp. SCGC AD-155-N22]|nr:class III signal peptide-containing protein [Methanothermococcus sp. SCGC AD-155-N22]